MSLNRQHFLPTHNEALRSDNLRKLVDFLGAQQNIPNVSPKLLHPVQDNNTISMIFNILQVKKHYDYEI